MTSEIIVSVSVAVSLAVAGWVVVDRLTRGRDRRNRQRVNKANIRSIAKGFSDYTFGETCSKLDQWWLASIDDNGWRTRRAVNRRIAEFKGVQFPVRDWDVNIEDEYTPERTEPFGLKLAEANRSASAILERIVSTV